MCVAIENKRRENADYICYKRGDFLCIKMSAKDYVLQVLDDLHNEAIFKR